MLLVAKDFIISHWNKKFIFVKMTAVQKQSHI